MFCVAKKNKDKYIFILSERTRDKATKKVKSKDKYITTVDIDDIIYMRVKTITKFIFRKADEKKCTEEEKDMLLDKYLDIRTKLIKENQEKEDKKFKQQQEEARKKAEEQAKFWKDYNAWSKDNFSSFGLGGATLNFDETTNKLAIELVKAGWKSMAKKHHPDLTNDNGENMKRINEIKEKILNLLEK
ncbi:molecular chaperone DnaJ [Clostridium botulinum D/C]|uniref:molecular chaperone DnaJ n=1 Tax=Clostridium botulinum TaxID=1491 RepID=UPI001E60CB80|nr:molecular chaperone DnaJ [Clostridium botulinum]MCD3240839.1 molecular chaperone DnaJ [Clostridium botulinum D/C]